MTIETWSERHFQTLTPEQHSINNRWFKDMLSLLKDDGVLGVPMLNKCFDKQGREVTELWAHHYTTDATANIANA